MPLKNIINFFQAYKFTDAEKLEIQQFMEFNQVSSHEEIMQHLEIEYQYFANVKRAMYKFDFIEVDDCSCVDPLLFYIGGKNGK